MDQDAFRSTYRSVNDRFCVFEKAILARQCACSMAHTFCIAEREGVHCGSDEAQAACVELLALLRERARFALKLKDTAPAGERSPAEPGAGALPHAKAMRIQVGGLKGIAAALDPDAPVPATIPDIRAIVEAAIARFGSLARLPFQDLVRHIAAYQGRRRSRRAR